MKIQSVNNLIVFAIPVIYIVIGNFDNCKNQSNKKNQPFGAIVSYSMPIVNWNGNITNNNSSYKVFYYEGLIMYNFFYTFDSTDENKVLLREKRSYFFVFHKDSTWGYNYLPNSQYSFPSGRFLVDSVLKKNTFENKKLDTLVSLKPDSAFHKKGIFIKVYNMPVSKEYPEKFTIYLNYAKRLGTLKESFSPNIDEVKDLKLFKIVILAHGTYYEQYKMIFPRREFIYEMKETSLEENQKVFSYFTKYKAKLMTK